MPKAKMQKDHSATKLVGAISGDRFNMNRAIDSQPTAEMRAELAKAGTPIPDGAELTNISTEYHQYIADYRHLEGKAKATTWFNLFAEVDRDGSGDITFDELMTVTRQQLRIGPNKKSDAAIKALWCALDVDDSNMVVKDEMAAFFRLGDPAVDKSIQPKEMEKTYTASNLVGAISGDRYNMNRAIDSQPTAEMRAELAEANFELPTDEELNTLSKNFNEWIEDMRHQDGKDKASTWFQLYAEVDEDDSGYITFDELTKIMRRKLKKSESVLSDNSLKALWCSLDADDSNAVQKDEMASFFRRGAPNRRKGEQKLVAKDHSSSNLVGAISGDRTCIGFQRRSLSRYVSHRSGPHVRM